MFVAFLSSQSCTIYLSQVQCCIWRSANYCLLHYCITKRAASFNCKSLYFCILQYVAGPIYCRGLVCNPAVTSTHSLAPCNNSLPQSLAQQCTCVSQTLHEHCTDCTDSSHCPLVKIDCLNHFSTSAHIAEIKQIAHILYISSCYFKREICLKVCIES